MAHDYTLKPHPTIPKADGPVLVCILDGFGENEFKDGYNAVHTASTPTVDAMRAVAERYRTVKAHGTAVGLPSDADMGNSEVGHNALGAGQVVDQGARLVDIALETGKMFEGAGWKLISGAFADHTVHFIGLLSDGGVHSRADQLHGCIKVRQPAALTSMCTIDPQGATGRLCRCFFLLPPALSCSALVTAPLSETIKILVQVSLGHTAAKPANTS